MHSPQTLPPETAPAPLEGRRKRLAVSLFWRTFILLGMLLLGSTIAWVQTFRTLEYEPRVVMVAEQMAALVNLTRAAVIHAEPKDREQLLRAIHQKEHLVLVPREPTDTFVPYTTGLLEDRTIAAIRERLTSPDAGTQMASSVNGRPGLWLSFQMQGDDYWLAMDPSRINAANNRTWLIWLITAAALSLAGAAVIAQLINHPLQQLSFAASRIRDGDFDASHLDEQAVTPEIRQVNIGFNRMAEQLAKIEQDRAVMLAGISHDLRTPLARLRLETEMSVADENARNHMAADIDQLDAIIDKFLDYARPTQATLEPVRLLDVVEACAYPFQNAEDIHIHIDIPDTLEVMADSVELARVVANLMENARRYGKSVETGVANVEVRAKTKDNWVLVKVRDHGIGVAPDTLSKLTKPFFRGDAARTAATGAGLGLSIVEKTVQRMGGVFTLSNHTQGGLSANIRLHQAR